MLFDKIYNVACNINSCSSFNTFQPGGSIHFQDQWTGIRPENIHSGNIKTQDIFAEAQLPIITDGVVYDLTLNAGYRYSKYETSADNSFNTDTYKFGFEFAPMFRPITPLPELVRNAALVRISSVNEPFVPVVTVPLMLLVTLFKVVVAPSATTCACNA